ncbi:MAG: copper-binding protein [Proteobacteria bacterium]|nr:copper-binding protein [Pseudomonadota bacterium]
MKKLLLTTALMLLATPAFAKEYIIKEISDPAGSKPYYFSPDKLTIQPGDTVTFVDAQEDMHDVMFINVPKGVDEMIMSPMHNKEGDKFSYTFKIPGTYQFHCHPHEALGMKGTLIVGTPSKPGETKAMDHHKMAKIHDDAMKAQSPDAKAVPTAESLPQGTAMINAVDAEKHTINVTHDPIKALGWPKMKMEFSVDKSVDLSGFKAGDAVLFTLKPAGDDDYTVVQLKKGQ